MMVETAGENMASILEALCARIANANSIADQNRTELEYERSRHNGTRGELTRAKDDARKAHERAGLLQSEANMLSESAERGRVTLDKYDRLTLNLYLYMVELAGHRDTAKTKAERVALGHVVERLADIRGVNDQEREEIS